MDVTYDGDVAILTLDRPPVNAFDARELGLFRDALAKVASSDARALVVTSAGKHFCAGADIALIEHSLSAEGGVQMMTDFAADMQRCWAELESLPIPTIAAITGAATGGGLELALACDIRVTAADSRLGLPEARLGLLPAAGGTQRLTRLAGPGVAARLMMSAELIDGAAARRLGIVEEVVAAADVRDTAVALAHRMERQSGAALAAIKRCIAVSWPGHGYAMEIEMALQLHAHDDTRARLRKFLNHE